jgi:hypothetical protein
MFYCLLLLGNRKFPTGLVVVLANFFSFLLGKMPLCHGASGLAANYGFGPRSAGSNLYRNSVMETKA